MTSPTNLPHPAQAPKTSTWLVILGVLLLLPPLFHLIVFVLGMFDLPLAYQWFAIVNDPFGVLLLLSAGALVPGFACLVLALRRAPSRTRLILASIAPSIMALYGVVAFVTVMY